MEQLRLHAPSPRPSPPEGARETKEAALALSHKKPTPERPCPLPHGGEDTGEGDGGVMHQPHLLPRIREACRQALHSYLPRLKTPSDVEAYIVAPASGDEAGVIGPLHLAQEV